ncbi:MAG TPA: HAD-IA family hydrolase [Armatimonadota bacterium]
MAIDEKSTSINDYIEFETEHGRTRVLAQTLKRFRELEGIIFDIDGVLLDVSDSIKQVHRQAVGLYLSSKGWTRTQNLVNVGDVDALRLAGGFNSDWDMGEAIVKLYLFKRLLYQESDGEVLRKLCPSLQEYAEEIITRGSGLPAADEVIEKRCNDAEWKDIRSRFDRQLLERLFMEVYSGDLCREVYGFPAETFRGPGLIHQDRPLLNTKLIPDGVRIGIATGRTGGETAMTLKLMEWNDIFPPNAIVTEDDGFKKPDPGILRLASERIGTDKNIYIGDTPDDLRTVRQYDTSEQKMLACTVLSGLDAPSLAERFMDQKSDMIADNVNAALEAIERCMGGLI